MREVRFRCRVLTPMFLGGPDPDTPEFRPPSIRGLLRYWYRALLGATGIGAPDRLQSEEAKIFGSTEVASSLRVRVVTDGDPDTETPNDLLEGRGRSYLWHFIQAGANDRSGIAPDETFELRLTAIPRHKEHSADEVLQAAVRALWLLTHLGGLGMRSRRFAGAFRARYTDCPDDISLPSFSPAPSYPEWIRAQLASIVPDGPAATSTRFNHLGRARVWIVPKRFDDYNSVVDTVGVAYKAYRKTLTDGQKVGFGLPIGQGGDAVRVERSNSDGSEKIKRLASPLWMQLVEDSTGGYLPVFALFEGDLLPNPEEVQVNGNSFGSVVEQKAPEFVEKQEGTQIYSH